MTISQLQFQFMILRWIVLIFLICSSSLFAQDRAIQLEENFLQAETDSIKFKAFESLFMYNITRDYDKAKSLLKVMDSLCSEIHLEDCRALESLFNGYYHRVTGNYDSSLYFLDLSYNQYREIGNESKMGVCLFNQGVVTSYKGDYEGAVEKYIEARDVYEKAGNINGMVNISNSLGIIYKNIKDYDKSKESYKQGLIRAKSTNNIPMEAMIYNNISNLFHFQSDFPDSVIYYASLALDLEIELDRNTGIASAHNLISAAFLDKNDKNKTIFHANEALKYSKNSKSKRFIVIHEISLADILVKFNNYNTAKDHYESSLAIADSIGLLDYQAHGYKNYSELLAKIGDHKAAYQARLKYEEHQDSIDIEESRVAIADLETKYETALKDKEIQSQELEISRRTYQRNLLFSGLALSLLLGGSIIWGIYSRLRRNKKINIQETAISKQKIENLEQEKKLLSLSSLLEGQETERIRIAKDLHDGLGGLLTSVKAHVNKIQSEIKKVKEMDLYKNATSMIDKAHEEVRRISHNLMPGELRVGGLIVSVEKLVLEMNDVHGIDTSLETTGEMDMELEEKKELSIYRIIQELLNNVVKYSESSSAFVQLTRSENELQILVEDNGVGFDYEKAINSEGFGLKSVQSRIDQMNGNLDVDSRQGEGSQFTINIPIEAR